MGFLTFVTVSVATMTGVIAGALLVSAFLREDDTIPPLIGLVAVPMPAMAAVLGFLFVARYETGRKLLAALAVFFATLASTILFAAVGLTGFVLAAVAAGGFGVLARRLLDDPQP
jgi:O-antigen/teichoic acid export membrane protein